MSAYSSNQALCRYIDPFTGVQCNKSYSKTSNLTRHIKKYHNNATRFPKATGKAMRERLTGKDVSTNAARQQQELLTEAPNQGNGVSLLAYDNTTLRVSRLPSMIQVTSSPSNSSATNAHNERVRPQMELVDHGHLKEPPRPTLMQLRLEDCHNASITRPFGAWRQEAALDPRKSSWDVVNNKAPVPQQAKWNVSSTSSGSLIRSTVPQSRDAQLSNLARSDGSSGTLGREQQTARPESASSQPDADSEGEGYVEADAHPLLRTSSVRPGRDIPIAKFNRVSKSETQDLLPTYQVKQSKKIRGQQRALRWLTIDAKTKFDAHYEDVLSQWGVKSEHKGTCVLLPEAWRATDPLKLMDHFRRDRYPASHESRAAFSLGDHSTSFARALAWFQGWPRNGVELDNFLGDGPFKPMEASHLCHHGHCINHLIYEPALINQDRQGCAQSAKSLRAGSQELPVRCSRHNPPCLLQHASLTTFEAYSIQFAVLRKAKGLMASPARTKPRIYRYPTLETQLPCSFETVTVRPEDLISDVRPSRKEGKPELNCSFCTHDRFYQSIAAFWSHIVYKHEDISPTDRLNEVRRTAELWRVYWQSHSDGGKCGNLTAGRLAQALQSGFSWQDVEGWYLPS